MAGDGSDIIHYRQGNYDGNICFIADARQVNFCGWRVFRTICCKWRGQRYNPAMVTVESIRHRRQEILDIAARYGAHDVRLFGSVARGDQTEASDLDLVVRFDPDRSLFDHGGLLMDLRELLGMKVDVVSEEALTGRFGQLVRKEAVPL